MTCMQPRSILSVLAVIALCSGSCRRNDDNTPAGAYSGVVVHKSCATTVVKIFNSSEGVSWLNCHDQQRYEHVVDLHISGSTDTEDGLVTGQWISFDIVPEQPYGKCKVYDCVPDKSVTVVMR